MTNINTTAAQKIGRRAARRAQAQQTALMPDASLTPSQVADLGVKLEELNKLYNESDGDVRNNLASDIANLKRILTKAKVTNTDPLLGILIDEALSEHRVEVAGKKEKTTLDLWRYRQAVVTTADILGTTAMQLIDQLHAENVNGSFEDKQSAQNDALCKLEELIYGLPQEPVTIDGTVLHWRDKAQSQLAEIFQVAPGSRTHKLITVDHDIWGLLNVPNADDVFHHDIMDNSGSARLINLATAFINFIDQYGLILKFEDACCQYHVLVASNSGLKTGTLTMAEHGALIKHRDALMFGLESLGDTNGQEQLKVLALLSTPSKIIEDTTVDEQGTEHVHRVHFRDIIMVDEIQIHLPVKSSIYVGRGSDVDITLNVKNGAKTFTLPVTVNNDILTIRKQAGFDGMMLGKHSGQIRGSALKGLSVQIIEADNDSLVKALIDAKPELYGHLRGQKLTIIDTDRYEREWTPDTVIATTTCWKVKKWFNGIWHKYVSNCEALAKKYDGFDCLRIAAMTETEEEMETRRNTARQLLSQFIAMNERQIRKLLARGLQKTKDKRTIDGALRYLSGAGKSSDCLTQIEWVFKLAPSLTASSKIGAFMMSQWLDELASMAACRIGTDEVTLFMAQDPAAMIEIVLFGMDPSDPRIGVLKAGEFCTPSLEDGQEAVCVRYPANGQTAMVLVNRQTILNKYCKNIISINIYDSLIIRIDGDCDGDHLALYLRRVMLDVAKENERIIHELGLDGVVLFEHGESAERRAATKQWMHEGRVTAIVNGMVFNYVGKLSNAALWATSQCSKAYHDGNRELAYKYGMLANVFATAAILTIDWCKTGVPSIGTEGRAIFDIAMEMLEYVGGKEDEHIFGAMPWAQAFRNHSRVCSFLYETQAEQRVGRKGMYYKHTYSKPCECTIDKVAAAVMHGAGIDFNQYGEIVIDESVEYDFKGQTFDPSVIGWTAPITAPRKSIVNASVLKYINPDCLTAELLENQDDARTAEAIREGKPVGFLNVMRFGWRMLSTIERNWAREARTEGVVMTAVEEKELVYASMRSVLHSMLGNKPWIMHDVNGNVIGEIASTEEKWQIAINYILQYAFELGKTIDIGGKDDTAEQLSRKNGSFAMFCLKVFAPDLLERIEIANHVHHRHARTEFINVKTVEQRMQSYICNEDDSSTDDED